MKRSLRSVMSSAANIGAPGQVLARGLEQFADVGALLGTQRDDLGKGTDLLHLVDEGQQLRLVGELVLLITSTTLASGGSRSTTCRSAPSKPGLDHHENQIDIGQHLRHRAVHGAIEGVAVASLEAGRIDNTYCASSWVNTPLCGGESFAPCAETMLIFCPTKRLSSVDLPTFGRPTMAMKPQ